MSGTLKELSRQQARSLYKKPGALRELLKSLTSRAAKGDRDAATQLKKVLAAHPELTATTAQAIEDLSQKAEAAWIKLISAGNQIAADALRAKVAAMKAELRTLNPGVLGEILINDVVVSHLANLHAGAAAAAAATMPVAAHQDRRAESAQRRVATAIKTWQRLARKVTLELPLPPGVQLLEPQPARPRRRRDVGPRRHG